VSKVLKGVIRKKLIEVAGKHFEVEERDVSLEEIKSGKEAFITSTTKTILPVRQIDKHVFYSKDITLELRDRLVRLEKNNY
jgi:branched-chain amino acid aminotransferase